MKPIQEIAEALLYGWCSADRQRFARFQLSGRFLKIK